MSHTGCRCRGRRPRRPAEVKTRRVKTLQKINGWQRQDRGPGVPGPYGLLFPVQKFSKNNLANARIICYDNKLKTCSVPKGHGHIEQRESF